jgi:KaiC/GvpD/RAD55 family RecA-like ATPase
MNLKKEMESNQTLLLIMDSFDYNKDLIKTAKQLSGKKVCYVTLNKTHDSLKELFIKNKVDTKNFACIDAISKTIKNMPSQKGHCTFCSSPAALTEISLAVSKLLKNGFEYLIFDSLTNLLIYQKKAPVAKFVSQLVNQIKAGRTKAIFYALSVKEQDDLIRETGMFVDNVIELK